MKTDADGFYSDFCCDAMEEYTRGAQKCITFDPFYKKYDMEEPEARACIYKYKAEGQAKIETKGMTTTAGKALIPINFCPFCARRISFEP